MKGRRRRWPAGHTELKGRSQTLAEKLIADGLFTSEAYEKATEPPVVLKEQSPSNGPVVTFAINGKMLPGWDWDYRAGAGSYIVTPYLNGKPLDDYEVEVEAGKGTVTKNGDGTFTVDFPATEDFSISLLYNFQKHVSKSNLFIRLSSLYDSGLFPC